MSSDEYKKIAEEIEGAHFTPYGRICAIAQAIEAAVIADRKNSKKIFGAVMASLQAVRVRSTELTKANLEKAFQDYLDWEKK